MDKNPAYRKAIEELIAAKKLPDIVKLRQSKYLNNIVEQNCPWLKRLIKPGMGFGSFNTQGRTIIEYKILNMMDEKRTSLGSSQGSHQRADYLPQPHFQSGCIEKLLPNQLFFY